MNSLLSRGKRVASRAIAGAVLGAVMLQATSAFAATPINLYGSTTVNPIAQDSIYQFQAEKPQYTLSINTVYAGISGSGGGRKALLDGVADVGMSSSNISSSDVCSTGHNPCYLYTDVVDNQVAYDAVVMLVNNNNPCAAAGRPLVNITKTAIKNAFQWRGNLHPSGVAPTWDSLCPGSVLAPIVPRFRDIGSGTRASFDSFIGLNENGVVTGQDDEQSTASATGLQRGAGNPDMVNFVAANPNQISYVGLAFAAVQGDTPGQFSNPNTYALAYDSGNGTPIQATTANVKSFAYGMSRFLHMYTINQSVKPDAPAVDYVNWILGPKGQALVDLEGFVPITTPPPAWDVNTDHVADIGDVVAIGSFWTQTAPLNYLGTAPFKGWLRQDANADGSIDIGDVVYVGGHWQATW